MNSIHWTVPMVVAVVSVLFLFLAYQPRHTVLYFAPWCGHCKTLMPVWDELQKELGSLMQKIDCTQDGNNCGIQAFPTIILYSGWQSKKYEGPRTKEALRDFIVNYQL